MALDASDFVILDASDIEDINQTIPPLSPSQIEDIQTWLQPTNFAGPSSEYGKHLSSRIDGTGSWIHRTPQYQQWHDGDAGTLWIKAVAGSGKSVVAASLIADLMQEEAVPVPVIYFFFRNVVSASRKPLSMVRDGLAQLLRHSPYLQHMLNDILKEQRPLETVSFDEMWKLLISSMLAFKGVNCIVDALDEMEAGNEHFIKALVALGRRRPTAIKVALTSRPVPYLENLLRDESVTQLQLQSKLINSDVQIYLEYRIHEFNVDEKTRVQICKAMLEKADGHFLYARLMMDELLEVACTSKFPKRDLSLALGQLPLPMADMYSRMLRDHSQRSSTTQDLQVTLLQWVTQAERPLRLLELSSLTDTTDADRMQSAGNKSIIRNACGPLLEILEDETVCPIHHSLTEFLYDTNDRREGALEETFPIFHQKDVHRTLALACIKLLKTGWYSKWREAESISDQGINKSELQRLKLEFPFLDYAANYWSVHVRKSDARDEIICSMVYDLLVKDSTLRCAWIDVAFPRSLARGRNIHEVKTWSPLHLAAEKGLSHIVSFWIEQGADMEAKAAWMYTPMSLAAGAGHTDTVEILLQFGAKQDQPDSAGLTPLHLAAENGHGSTVSALLKSGVNPLIPKTSETPGQWSPYSGDSTIGQEALTYACQRGHVDVVRAFMPYVAIDSIYQALDWACARTQSQVVLLLLDVPELDVNYRYKTRTLLFLVAEAGDPQAMYRLIARGADTHALSTIGTSIKFTRSPPFDQQPEGLTPLHAFVCGGDTHGIRWSLVQLLEGLKLLLDTGIDVNAIDFRGWTILHHLMRGTGTDKFSETRRDELDIVLTMLFERGLCATSLTQSGASALVLAIGISASVIDLLISHGLDANQADSSGDTPLIAALRRHDLSTAQALLDAGADPNIADSKGNTPLHVFINEYVATEWRTGRDNVEFAQSLVNAGARVCTQNVDGDSALHCYARKATMLKFFLDNGFDLEMKNHAGETVLNLAVSGLEYEAFIAAGANPCTRDEEGRSILHHIVEGVGFEDAVGKLKFFIEKGNSIHTVDDFGNSLWHVVARHHGFWYGKLDCVMDFITSAGVSTRAPNHEGTTPLHIACCISPNRGSANEVLSYLLKKNADVDAMDNNQLRPLHIAAYSSLSVTALLLEHGANLTAQTSAGQTALMIACRFRMCDRVCLILDHYKEQKLDSMIDQFDKDGRSALHYACRSGRPEIVALLLDHGASIHISDNAGLTPLHTCAEYLEERELWDPVHLEYNELAPIPVTYPSHVGQVEATRPYIEYDPDVRFRIRQTVRLLIAHGADTTFLTEPVEQVSRIDPLSMALSADCDVMVNELLITKAKLLQVSRTIQGASNTDHKTFSDGDDTLSERAETIMNKHLSKIVQGQVLPGDHNMELVKELLRNDEEPSIKLLYRLGAQYSLLSEQNDSPVIEMIKLGFTQLVREFAQDESHVSFTERAKTTTLIRGSNVAQNMLVAALRRDLPNMDMLKMFATEFKFDLNEEFYAWTGMAGLQLCRPIHHLAISSHWWQTNAMEFLLDWGCDIEAVDSQGHTALLIALGQASVDSPRYLTNLRNVKILLRRGANANAINNDGNSCLNIAAGRPELFRLLLNYGADPTYGPRSALCDAVVNQNLETLHLLLEAKVDVNRRSKVGPDQVPQTNRWLDHYIPEFPMFSEQELFNGTYWVTSQILLRNAYPLHIAAASHFNSEQTYTQAVHMTEALLAAGGNPHLMYQDRISILHTLAEQGGILEPFLKNNRFDLEQRDHLGRTVLLAACDSPVRRFVDLESIWGPSMLIKAGASITAVDNQGRSALHCLVSHHFTKIQLLALREHRDFIIEPPLYSMTDEFLSALMTKTDNQGRTALQYALTRYHFDLIDSFITNGADPLHLDPEDGTNILHHLAAGLASYDDIIIWDNRSLTPNDVLPDADRKHDPSGATGRHFLLEKGLVDLADMEERDLASAGRHFKKFVKQGLSVNAQDKIGDTPLLKFAAATPIYSWPYLNIKCTLLPVLELFEQSGVDFSARNFGGESVLHKLAKLSTIDGRDSHKESIRADLQAVVSWLLKRGVDLSWEDAKSRTCLDVAATSGAQWLLDMYKRE